jgi:hypothetical protein
LFCKYGIAPKCLVFHFFVGGPGWSYMFLLGVSDGFVLGDVLRIMILLSLFRSPFFALCTGF